jgi:hypothetical protein
VDRLHLRPAPQERRYSSSMLSTQAPQSISAREDGKDVCAQHALFVLPVLSAQHALVGLRREMLHLLWMHSRLSSRRLERELRQDNRHGGAKKKESLTNGASLATPTFCGVSDVMRLAGKASSLLLCLIQQPDDILSGATS